MAMMVLAQNKSVGMKSLKFGAVALLMGGLAACEGGTKERVGTVAGAATGAVLGSKVGKGSGNAVAIAVGTLLGALMGSEIGKSLDRADRIAMGNTTQEALENGQSGQAQTWSNPDSGHSGTVTPQPAYKNTAGNYCREYQQTVMIDGREESAYGTACRQPDGSWKIVEG